MGILQCPAMRYVRSMTCCHNTLCSYSVSLCFVCAETCTPYTGEFCSPLGYTSETSVVLHRNLKESVDILEAEILGRLYSIRDLITPGCEQALRQLVCYGALPTCNGNGE